MVCRLGHRQEEASKGSRPSVKSLCSGRLGCFVGENRDKKTVVDDNLEAGEVTGNGRTLARGEMAVRCDTATKNLAWTAATTARAGCGEVARSRTASSLSCLETLRFKTLAGR